MAQINQHVVPKNGGWAVRKQGSAKATKIFTKQSEAIQFARSVAQRHSGELYIHEADGTIRERRSYGNDPCPPRDKN